MSKPASTAFAVCWAMFVLLFAPAFAADPPQPQPQAGTPPPADAPTAGSLDEVVCKVREEPIIGTRIVRKRKVCRTRREWLEETRIAQDALNDVQESGRTQNGIEGGRKGGGGN